MRTRIAVIAPLLAGVLLLGLGSCDLLEMLFGGMEQGVTIEERLDGFLTALNAEDRSGIQEHFVGAQDYESLASPTVIDGFFPPEYIPYLLGAVEPSSEESPSTLITTLTHTGTGTEIDEAIRFDLIETDGDWFINKIYYPYVVGDAPIIQRLSS